VNPETPRLPDKAERLLVIRQSALGDVVNALYLLRPIRRAYPNVRIAWLVDDRFRELFDAVEGVDEVLVFPRRRWGPWLARPWRWPRLVAEWIRYARALRDRKFDAAIDFQGNGKSRLSLRAARVPVAVRYRRVDPDSAGLTPPPPTLRAERFAAMLVRAGLDAAPEPIPFRLPSEADRAVEAYLRSAGLDGRSFAVLHPGTSGFGAYKRWPADRFAALAGRLAGAGMPVLVAWGPGERPLAESVATEGQRGAAGAPPGRATIAPALETRSLPVLMALVGRAAVFIGNDSGPLHLAGACGTPTVGLYGPKDPRLHAPYASPRAVLYAPLPCSPCGRRACDNPECMKALTVDYVYDRVQALLRDRRDVPAEPPLRGPREPGRLDVESKPPELGGLLRFRVGAWRWAVSPDLAGPWAGAAKDSGEGLPGTPVAENRRRRFLRHRLRPGTAAGLPADGSAGLGAFIKVYPIRRLGARLRAWFGRSQADIEFRRLRRLHAVGAPVPRPIALGHGPEAHALALEDYGEAPTARSVLATRPDGSTLRRLLDAMADAIAGLHETGFVHADLHAGNLLRLPSGSLRIVDVHRGRDLSAKASLADRAVSLAHLLVSISTFAGVTCRVRLLRRYAERSGLGRAALRPLATAVDRAYARLRRRYALGQMARARRGSSRIWIGAWRDGRARADRDAKAWLDEPETIETVLKSEAGRRVLRIRKGALRLAVKEDARRRRGRLAWAGAHGFQACHLPTPSPVFLVEPRDGPSRLATAWIDGAEPLGAYLDATGSRGPRPARRRRIAWDLGRFVRRIHDAGVYHADLKAGNVIARDTPEGRTEFFALDLDRLAFYAGPVPRSRALANLAQLNAALADPVTRTDRLRCFFAYAARDRDLRRAWKGAVRDVMRRTRARRHRWPPREAP
jgi:ADP-heptose:LPS heptosyltransferase/tRNA A-37 threonylcarbamoyl transferase component Bud32